jgi:hypothetical protein
MKWKLQKVTHIEFYRNPWKVLWDTWTIIFMASCKLGFILGQCG